MWVQSPQQWCFLCSLNHTITFLSSHFTVVYHSTLNNVRSYWTFGKSLRNVEWFSYFLLKLSVNFTVFLLRTLSQFTVRKILSFCSRCCLLSYKAPIEDAKKERNVPPACKYTSLYWISALSSYRTIAKISVLYVMS